MQKKCMDYKRYNEKNIKK